MGIPGFILAGAGKNEFVNNGNNMTGLHYQARNDQYPTLEKVYYGALAVILFGNILAIFALFFCIAVVVMVTFAVGLT